MFILQSLSIYIFNKWSMLVIFIFKTVLQQGQQRQSLTYLKFRFNNECILNINYWFTLYSLRGKLIIDLLSRSQVNHIIKCKILQCYNGGAGLSTDIKHVTAMSYQPMGRQSWLIKVKKCSYDFHVEKWVYPLPGWRETNNSQFQV